MADFTLAVLVVHSPPTGSTLSANDNLLMYWDSTAGSIKVKKNGVAYTGSGDIGVLNTNYRFMYGISSYSGNYAISNYSFCDSTTLKWFRMNLTVPSFPYFTAESTANSTVCAAAGGAVCDIHFTGPATVTHATNLSGNNGQIVVTATSSNGSVKYALEDFVYSTGGQASGTFSSLSPGTYTVYAKDTNDCTTQIEVTVLYKPAEGEHYRFYWKDDTGVRRYRIRIYEREYTGDVVEPDYAGMPIFELRKPRAQNQLNNKFYPLHPSSAQLILMNETDYQWINLYTQDQKRFRVVYEIDDDLDGTYDQKWQGYIVPSVYSEPWIAAPYPSVIQIADNMKVLESLDFADDNGNLLKGDMKLIKIIAFIMKKTGLSLNIRSGINIFEENHNTAATDDPLDQTYVDVTCYQDGTEPFKCSQVLESILQPFGARIFQYENSWIIEEIDRTNASYAYRVFDSDGVYSSNSTFDPVIDIVAPSSEGAMFLDQDQTLEVIPAYGKINVISNLNHVGAIVSGGFEKKDLLSPESETFLDSNGVFLSEEGFDGWALRVPATVSGVSFGRIELDNRSVGSFYYNTSSWSGNPRDTYIESTAKNFQYGPADELRFSFEHSSPAPAEYEFMPIQFVIKVGSNYLQEDLSWSASEHIFRVYQKPGSVSSVSIPRLRTARSGQTESFSTRDFESNANTSGLQKFEITAPLPSVNTITDTTIQVRIYFYAAAFYDCGSPSADTDPENGTDGLTDLDAIVTTTIDYNYAVDVRLHRSILGNFIAAERGFYQLRISDASEDSPDIIRVGDYDGTNNPKVWWRSKSIIDNATAVSNGRGSFVKFFLDNVSVDSLPNGQEPPETETITYEVSKYIDEFLDVELYNFDLPDITNGKNMYNNYFKLSDGTPTSAWTRTGVAESLPLQQILLRVLGSNHSAPTFKLTGSVYNSNSTIGPNNTLRITKSGSNVSLSNTEFTSNLNGWSQTGSGEAFAWSASNGGSAAVTLSGAEDSQKIYQDISHTGGFITITCQVHTVPAVGNDREDALKAVYYRSGSIVHEERLKSFASVSSEADYEIEHVCYLPATVDRIALFFKRVSGTGECTYQVGEFSPAGSDVTEVYQIADFNAEVMGNKYFFELTQISKSYITLQGIDSGGTGQGDGTTGNSFSGDFNDDFGGDFDTTLN